MLQPVQQHPPDPPLGVPLGHSFVRAAGSVLPTAADPDPSLLLGLTATQAISLGWQAPLCGVSLTTQLLRGARRCTKGLCTFSPLLFGGVSRWVGR